MKLGIYIANFGSYILRVEVRYIGRRLKVIMPSGWAHDIDTLGVTLTPESNQPQNP